MKFIIDRFEGDYAILEDENKNMLDILKSSLPDKVKEGDVLILKSNSYTIDQDETNKRKDQIQKLMNELWE